jgi:peptide/nickel transport system substrate-binding protein
MRKIYWYLTAYIKKHGLTFALSSLGAILVFSLLMPFLVNKITIKQKKYIGIVGEYNLQALPTEVKNKLSVGLTKVDEQDQSIKPLLAERWVTENDGKTYRFSIKKNITWQDGEPLTPDDINYNFQDVETITTPNDIIFKLPDTFAPFPSIVTEPIFKQAEQNYLLFFKKPTVIGIGPYKINSYKMKGSRLEKIVIDGPDDRLIYRFYLTESDAINGFKKGEVDILRDIRQPKDLKNWSDKYVLLQEKINYDQYLAVFFNNSLPLLNKNTRQALAYALDKPSGDIRALGPINPNSWAYLPGGKDYTKDWDRAAERLLATQLPEKIDLTLTTTPIFLAEAEDFKKQWEEFGQYASKACQTSDEIEDKQLCENAKITIKIKVSNFPDTSNYELLLMGQEIPVDPDQYFLWHSDQATNFTHYQNTRIDSLLEKGRQTLEYQDRLATYQEFQQFLLEDPPAIFLHYLISYDIYRN